MTVLVSWLSGEHAMLCWDSAISVAHHPPNYPQSSFGETQAVDEGRVEEAVLKVCNVRGLPAMIAGDMTRAVAYCEALSQELSTADVRTAVSNLRTIFDNVPDPFTVIVAHLVQGRAVLTRYRSSGKISFMDNSGEYAWIDGSLPANLRRLVRTGTLVVEKFPLSVQQRLLAQLAFMQAMGVANYLPEHGVGGAFCGAIFDGNIAWQEPIQYLITDPIKLAKFDNLKEIEDEQIFHRIRCLAGDWLGVVVSSITRQTTVLRSPSDERSTEALIAAAKNLSRDLRWVSPSSAYAFINVAKQRVVIAFPRDTTESILVTFQPREGSSEKFIFDGFILHLLSAKLDPTHWSIEVIIENAEGSDPSVVVGTLDLDQFIDRLPLS